MGRFILFFFLLFSSFLPAKPEEPKRVRVLRTREKITVDGRLDEPAWGKAEQISNFIQFQPERGKPASFPSSVKVLFDDNYVYFGFSCEDKEPGKVIARLTKRDADLWEDDSVTVFLDTFLDRRNGYYFSTNILGTQSDGRVVENGLTIDKTWDGIWKSAGQRTEFGWTAEVGIDLGSLKFKPGEERTWGFNVGRSIPRLFEYSFWAGPLESPYKVSQFGELHGLSLREARKKYQLIPHVISKAEEGMKTEAEAGLDARYAFSQAVSANLTLNPDFATVEADQEQINLTRFELNLPEKRNFFLEGSEIYRQRISLFYSRRIGDIVGGAQGLWQVRKV